MKKRKLYYIGNLLITVSAIATFFIFLPYFTVFLNPPVRSEQINRQCSVLIPKINAYAPIVKNVNPFNQQEYRKALKKGVAQAKGSFLPGEDKTVFLFAHSSDAPWNLSHYNTIFMRLGELTEGDIIKVFLNNKEYNYLVREKRIVWPEEVDYLKSTSKNELILQTCSPIGTDFMRLLIFADPVK